MNNEQVIGYYTLSHDSHVVTIKSRYRLLAKYLKSGLWGILIPSLFFTITFVLIKLFGGITTEKLWELLTSIVKYWVPFGALVISLLILLFFILNRNTYIHFTSKSIYITGDIPSNNTSERSNPEIWIKKDNSLKIQAITTKSFIPSIKASSLMIENSDIHQHISRIDIKNVIEAEAMVNYLKNVPGLL